MTNTRVKQQRIRKKSKRRPLLSPLRLRLLVAITVGIFILGFISHLVYTHMLRFREASAQIMVESSIMRLRSRPRTLVPHNFVPRDWEVLQIVHTRFMQHQPDLVWLGKARVLLFQTFCLPTIVKQTQKEFIWIISTDPDLDEGLRNAMIDLLEPYPNFYLVGSNANFGLMNEDEGSWHDGVEGRTLLKHPERIFTGNLELLKEAHELRLKVPTLDTRLDADDGIHIRFLEYLKASATRKHHLDAVQGDDDFEGIDHTTPDWFFWCAKRHFEWFPSRNIMRPIEHSKLCVSAGITVGYPAASAKKAPIHAHDVLYKRIKEDGGCGRKECIEVVDTLAICAIRSRTTTSAGMKDLDETSGMGVPKKEELFALMWNFTEEKFGIQEHSTQMARDFLSTYEIEIAQDNLKGQCTQGHSCKLQAKEELQRLVEQAAHGVKGYDAVNTKETR